jgi:hypothetical protein
MLRELTDSAPTSSSSCIGCAAIATSAAVGVFKRGGFQKLSDRRRAGLLSILELERSGDAYYNIVLGVRGGSSRSESRSARPF